MQHDYVHDQMGVVSKPVPAHAFVTDDDTYTNLVPGSVQRLCRPYEAAAYTQGEEDGR